MLTLHFDYPSPASAVALLRLERLAAAGHDVRFVGLDASGLAVSLPPTDAQLHEVAARRDEAARLGLRLGNPSRWPPTFAAHLLGTLADEVQRGTAWRSACLEAYWTDDVDLADEARLLELAVGCGLPRADARARLADAQARRTLRGRMAVRRRSGIGGVPVLEMDGGVYLSVDIGDEDLARLAAL